MLPFQIYTAFLEGWFTCQTLEINNNQYDRPYDYKPDYLRNTYSETQYLSQFQKPCPAHLSSHILYESIVTLDYWLCTRSFLPKPTNTSSFSISRIKVSQPSACASLTPLLKRFLFGPNDALKDL